MAIPAHARGSAAVPSTCAFRTGEHNMRRIYTATIVEVSRKMNRALALGKGIGLDADSLACMAAIGVNDLVQQKAAEYLREQALRRSVATGTRMPTPAGMNINSDAMGDGSGANIITLTSRHAGIDRTPDYEPESGARQHARASQRRAKASQPDAKEQLQRGLELCRPQRGK